MLRKYVKNGRVDYQSLRNDPEWKACCVELKETSPSRLQGKLEQLSFWINTYNLLTIKCVADSYPLARLSRESAERKFTVGGKPYSLAQIKEEIFPPLISTSDWRAIFLVCDGTTGAPAIVSHAYSVSEISDEFEPALKRFVLSPSSYAFNEKEQVLSISPFYRANLPYIDRIYASPFALINENLPAEKRINIAKVVGNYALSYDFHINDAGRQDVHNNSGQK